MALTELRALLVEPIKMPTSRRPVVLIKMKAILALMIYQPALCTVNVPALLVIPISVVTTVAKLTTVSVAFATVWSVVLVLLTDWNAVVKEISPFSPIVPAVKVM